MDGNLIGVVTDASGALMARASVSLENLDTGVKTATATNDAGAYRFNNVLAGNYRLTTSMTGFTTSTTNNVRLESNKTTAINVRLEVGAVTTAVEVVEATAAIDTTTANVTNTFDSRQALRLPSFGVGVGPTALGVINLSLLNAGVTSSGSVGYGTGPSVGGQRPTNNNFMIEGVDNNNRSVTGPQITVSNEAVAEFTLQQNQFSPEFGHSTGGQFNTLIKRGDNTLRGSLYTYHQNRNLTAIDESFKRQGIRNRPPRNDVNRLGATIGGPVVKNKIFYFGNFEYTPVGFQAAAPGAAFVPTADGYRTIESLPNISRTNLEVLKRYAPAAPAQQGTNTITVGGRPVPIGILRAQGPGFNNNYSYLASGDYNISERDQIRMRYLLQTQDSINTTGIQIPDFFTPVKYGAHLASITHFHTFSAAMTNELRLAYNRRRDERPVGEYPFQGLDVFPNLQFDDLGLAIGPNGSYPQGSRNNTFQLVENLSWTRGRHTIKTGYDGRKFNISSRFIQRERGEYIYRTLDRFLMDITPETGQRSVGGFPFVGNALQHGFYITDEWRRRPNLTLNIGARYEFTGVPTGARQQALNAIANVPGLIDFREPRATKKDWMPRLGLAYSPGQDGKTSIRAGFGMGYDQVYQNLGANSLPPQFFTTINAQDIAPNAPRFLAGGGIPSTVAPITSQATARLLTSSYIPDQIRPYSLQWNLGVQRVLKSDYTVEVRYLGSRGVHLPFQQNINRPASVQPNRTLPIFLQRPSQAELDALTLSLADFPAGNTYGPYFDAGFRGAAITAFTPQGNSSYHGLATQVNKRFSRDYQFVGAYTWSHLIDDSTAALNSTVTTPRRPQDFNNLRPERASSALDHRHRFTLSMVYESSWLKGASNWAVRNVVGNWQMSGTWTSQTGSWATLRSAVDSNRNGDPAGDRVWVNNAGDPKLGSGNTRLTNTRGQVVGYLATNPAAKWIAAGEGVMPTAGRNVVRMPGISNLDASVAKTVNLTERVKFEFRAELYNALNVAQYTPGFPSASNVRSRTGGAETNMLIPGTVSFLRPDLAFQSNSRGAFLVGRFQF
ncbi:MAG: TonB-dependent receptor [Acidobacteria bacterium]|nr:TonB-dependent receptor [Acidobacteriota bacterium]